MTTELITKPPVKISLELAPASFAQVKTMVQSMEGEEEEMRYQPYVPEPVARVDALYSLHYCSFRRGYAFPGEKHDFWELVYADIGGATIGNEGESFPLAPGQCFLHAPNAFHTICANLAPECSLFVMAFASESQALRALCRGVHALNTEGKRLIRRILIEGDALCGPVLDISDLEALALSESAPPGSGQVIVLNLELLLIQLLRGECDGLKRAPVTDEQGMQSLVEAAERLMRDHPDGSLHMEDVCRHVGVGPTTLKRLFRQCRETGVMERYQRLRLEEACRRLRTGRVNVSEVAYELGVIPAFRRFRGSSRRGSASRRGNTCALWMIARRAGRLTGKALRDYNNMDSHGEASYAGMDSGNHSQNYAAGRSGDGDGARAAGNAGEAPAQSGPAGDDRHSDRGPDRKGAKSRR